MLCHMHIAGSEYEYNQSTKYNKYKVSKSLGGMSLSQIGARLVLAFSQLLVSPNFHPSKLKNVCFNTLAKITKKRYTAIEKQTHGRRRLSKRLKPPVCLTLKPSDKVLNMLLNLVFLVIKATVYSKRQSANLHASIVKSNLP